MTIPPVSSTRPHVGATPWWGGWLARVGRLRQSLLGRLLFYTLVLVSLMTAVLFVGIDTLATRHFGDLRQQQRARLVEQVQQSLREESQRLLGLTRLAASDADLIHATYYHLHLQGERRHPQEALARLQRTLGFEALNLHAPNGQLAARVSTLARAPEQADDRGPDVQVRWHQGQAWLRVAAPVQRLQTDLATLVVWRTLDQVFDTVRRSNQARIAVVRLAQGALGPGDVGLGEWGAADSGVHIEVVDTAAHALQVAKQFLAVVLVATAAMLVALLAWVTRRELRPLADVVRAAQAIGRGQLGQQVRYHGQTEVGDLVAAFNLMSRQLLQARDLSQQMQHQQQLSAIGRMAARVAHDMNNPLTVISNTVRLMQKCPSRNTDEVAQDLELIHHHAQRCARIVAGLLDYARPLRLSLEQVDLAAWLATQLRRWSAARPQDPPVRLRCLSAEVWVRMDALHMERCLDNLLTNACQACPDGRVQVSLIVQADRAQVRVLDEGPGFGEAAYAHLFEPFYTSKPKGSGLGLASCLAILQAHGGGIEVPTPHRGEVLLWLPVQRPDQT